MKLNSRDLTSFGISLLLHIIAVGSVLVIMALAPRPEQQIRLEVSLTPLSSEAPITPQAAPEAGGQRSRAIEQPQQETTQAAEAPAETASARSEAAPAAAPAAAPVQTQPAQQSRPAPAQPQRPAAQQTPTPQTETAVQPSNPQSTTDGGLEVSEPARPNRSATDIGSFLNTDSADASDQQPPEGFIDQSAESPSSPQNRPADQADTSAQSAQSVDPAVQAQLAALQQRMNSNYADSPSDSPSPASPSASSSRGSSLSDNITGAIRDSGRGLLNPNQFDGLRDLTQRRENWPASLRVDFHVNEDGFVRILNEADVSIYNELSLKIYEMFSGPVFESSPGAEPVQGSISFRLR